MDVLIGYVNYTLFFSIQAGIFAVLCLGLNVQWGYTGLFNIGIAGFYAVGAYTSTLISGPPPDAMDWRTFGGFEMPFLFGLLGAMLVSGVVAFLISIPTLRLKDDYLAIATIGIAEVIRAVFQNEAWLSNGVWGIKHIPSPLQEPIQEGLAGFLSGHPEFPGWLNRFISNGYNWFYLGLVVAVLASFYWIIERLTRSPRGRVLKAIREDEVFAQAAGKNVAAHKVLVFVIGAGMAAVAGVMYAHYISFIDPTSFTVMESIFILSIVIIGGSGSLWGPVVGAVVLVVLPELLRFIGLPSSVAANLRQIIYGGLLVAFMMWRPQGFLGEYAFQGKEARE